MIFENGGIIFENGGIIFENGEVVFENGGMIFENGDVIFENYGMNPLAERPKRKEMEFKFVIPSSDTGVDAKLTQFKTGAQAELLNLGYDAADLDAIVDAATSFHTELVATEDARVVYRNQVGTKDETKAASVETIRIWAQRVKTNPLATPEILAKFGIEPSSVAAGPVTSPNNFSAQPFANGTCTLKWGSNGNVAGTTYVIESALSNGVWNWVDNTTKKTYTDEFATPGIQRTYRVRAQRAGLTSPPSPETSIYFGEGEGEGGMDLAA